MAGEVRSALARLGRPPVAASAAVLAVLALFDVAVVTPGWPWVLFAAVVALALGARSPGPQQDALTASAVAVSWAGTALMAVVDYRWAGSWGFAETAALLLLLVVRWRWAAGRGDWALTAAVALAVVALPLRLLSTDTPATTGFVAAATAVAVAVGVGLRSQDAQRALAVAAVRRAEREEVARELHDVVAHHVTGIVVATQAARTVAAASTGGASPAVTTALEQIEAAGAEALVSMRRLVGVLRTDPAAAAPRAPAPGLGDLADLVRRFRDAGAVGSVELTTTGDAAALPSEVQAAVYRVVQEALTNAARHAPGAARVVVSLTGAATGAVVEVLDSGAGQDPAPQPGGGFGIIGMRERVEALGGVLSAGPLDRGGWRVHAEVPVPAAGDGGGRSR